ncbi:MAG: superoxide dismutase [Planctomycetes bacterium]|nr:superoxide dismutase [Planctomycetota bacterium]
MPHQLPNLPYDHAALEPHIDAQTMQIHHSKHHQAYVNGLNAAEEALRAAMEKGDAKAVVKATAALNFHGGGHANHSLFWTIMGPKTGGEPGGDLGAAIKDAFGGFANFKTVFETQATGIQGSGWAWLCWEPTTKSVVIATTANQDNPVKTGLVPLAGIDVWEHAYYLKYQNRRPDYIKAWWNVVAWEKVGQNFQQARG